MNGTHLLLVDDDLHLATVLRSALSSRYRVTVAASMQQARQVIEAQRFTAYLVDIGLPDGSGAELVALIRRRAPQAGILMLTADATVRRKVQALDAGADDYLTKPFSLHELEARLRALGRRIPGSAPHEAGNITIGASEWQVRCGSTELHMPKKDFLLLLHLVQHQGRVLTRRQLGDLVWDDAVVSSALLSVHIHRLRAMLRKAGSTHIIRTVSGLGYVLEPEKGAHAGSHARNSRKPGSAGRG